MFLNRGDSSPRRAKDTVVLTHVEISDVTDSDAAHAACTGLPGFLGIIGGNGQWFARFDGEIDDIDELQTMRESVVSAIAAPAAISLGGASLIQQPALPDNPTFDDLVAAVRQLQGLVT